MGSGVRNLNCMAPEKTSKLAPEAPEGCTPCRVFAQFASLPTKWAGGRVGGASRGGPGGAEPSSGRLVG
eukprot:15447891-Alexandrium_andersonii.AAC.1